MSKKTFFGNYRRYSSSEHFKHIMLCIIFVAQNIYLILLTYWALSCQIYEHLLQIYITDFSSLKVKRKWPTNELLHLHLLLLQTTGVDFVKKKQNLHYLMKVPNNHITASLFRVSNSSNFKSIMANIDNSLRQNSG